MHNKQNPASNVAIHSISMFMNEKDEQCQIWSNYETDDACLTGSVNLTNLVTTETLSVTDIPGDYEHCGAVCTGGRTYVVYTAYDDRQKAIFLLIIGEDVPKGKIQLTDWGKFDFPSICVHQSKVVVSWENFSQTNSQIEYVIVGDDEPLNIQQATSCQERAYQPQMISNGDTLFLVYESFFQKRYHLMVRMLEDSHHRFSEAVEIGFDTLNDLSPSLWCQDGEIYVSWENSSPLYTDYVWKNHKGTDVTMPAFGHGWQVLCKMGFRKLGFDGETLTVSSLDTDWNAALALDNSESAGEPVVFMVEGNLHVAYVTKASSHYWQLAIKVLTGEEWKSVAVPEILFDYRVKPAIAVSDKKLIVSGLKADREIRSNELFQIELSDLEEKQIDWCVNKQIRLDKIFDTPGCQEMVRKSIHVNGEELQLFWGDLHMHSNLSICSLHPKFHCTELEVKHRFSRDVGGLDFNLLTDHQVMDNYEWLQTVKYAHLHDLAGTHVSFVGFEWTSSQLENFHNYGHYNVLYKDEGPLLRIRTGEVDTVEKVCDQLGQTPGMIIPHHPGEGVHPLDWNAFPESYSPLVEIFQVRGSYEADDCEMPPVNYGRRVKPGNSVQTGLKMGYRFGFTSGGEHEGVGITAVFAKECTRKAIYEALQKRQTYGTTEPRIFLDYRLNGALMGSEIKVNPVGTLRFTVHVQGTDLIESIHLVSSQGETVLWNSPVSKEVTLEMEQPFTQDTEWFYVRVKQTDGHLAWSSPVWVGVS